METLCWSCANATRIRGERECPWAWDFKPVPGWKAVPTGIYCGNHHYKTGSFCVIECPLYKNDSPVSAYKWTDERREQRREQTMKKYAGGDVHPPIYSGYGRFSKCRSCQYFTVTDARKRYGRTEYSGVCKLMPEEEKTRGSCTCAAFKEKGEPKCD